MTACKDCGATLHQQEEKALDGTFALVWANSEGRWVCAQTGDEHTPAP